MAHIYKTRERYSVGWTDPRGIEGAQPDSNRFSSFINAPLEKWGDNFGLDRGVVMKFLLANHDHMIERQLPFDRSEPMYVLRKANFDSHNHTTWEVIGVFDSAAELVAIIKMMQ